MLLAHASRDLQERTVAGPLRTFTAATIADGARLRSALDQVRREGVAFCPGHIHPDACGIAVPVRDPAGAVVAALAVIVPNDADARAQVPALRAAARGIGRQLPSR